MSSAPRDAPARQSIPPLGIAALFALLAVMLIEELSWRCFIAERSLLDCGLAVVIALVVVSVGLIAASRLMRARIRLMSVLLVLIAFMTTAACSTLHWNAWQQDARSIPELVASTSSIVLDITSDASQRDYGMISSAEYHDGASVTKLRVLWPQDETPVTPGHRIEAHGSLAPCKNDESGHWNHQNGYIGTMKVEHAEPLGLSPSLQGIAASFRDASFERIARLEGDAAGLLGGILLGNRTLFVSTELELSFQTTGLAHLMAVSGTHLAIVTLLISLVMGRTHLRRQLRNAAVLLALLAYVALTGFAPSAMRACVMCAVALLLGAMKRRAFALNGLALCVFVFLGLSPSLAYSMGFQLSVLSVLGLVIFSPLVQHWMETLGPRVPETLAASISATLAASCLTLPLTVAQFAQMPLISPLANIIVAPLITAALCVGVVGIVASALFDPLGSHILDVAGLLASLCAGIVRHLADAPGACLPVSGDARLLGLLFFVMLAVLWVIWPVRPEHRSEREALPSSGFARFLKPLCICLAPIALVICLGFGQHLVMTAPSDSRLVMLDVGQGDSILVQSKEATVLVDTGEEPDVLLRELAEQGISHLDAVFITHKDADHSGALAKLAGVVNVDHVYVHADLLHQEFEERVLEAARWATVGNGAEGVSQGSAIVIGDFTMTVIAPAQGGKSENEDSLVMLLEYDADHDGMSEVRGLLTGDAEHEALESFVESIGDIGFLKVAHHGSKGGATDEQLATLNPEVALISVGADNRYGHPNAETLAQCERNGARIYRTDEQGAVTLSFSKQGYAVFTER